tara:strand:+ start:320 stop:529 length:210 start_codon:yes stop_codon:yes gene_type:complete
MKIEINIYTMNKLYILLLLPILSCTTYDYVSSDTPTYYFTVPGKQKKEKQKKTTTTSTSTIAPEEWGCR